MSAKVVHHDDVAAFERRDERLTREANESLTRGPAFVGHHRAYAVESDCSNDGQVHTMPTRDLSVRALADGCSAVQARHLDVRAGFVHKTQTCSGRTRDGADVLFSSSEHVCSVALCSEDGLFLPSTRVVEQLDRR